MSDQVDPAPRPLVEAPALRTQVYERLRDSILGGELAPGEQISPSAIARRFGISAMPVRDALRQLEQDGLVETSSRRWTRVVELEPRQVEEIVPLVSLLEQYALTSAQSIPPEVIDRLRQANAAFARSIAEGDLAACIEADVAFHDALVTLPGNDSLQRALRDTRARIRLLRPQVLRPELAARSVADHERIIERLEQGDREGAAAAVDRNWRRGLERFRSER